MRLVHLKIGHFGEKNRPLNWQLLFVIGKAIGKVYRSQLCILSELVFTFHLGHSRALNT